jgi:hypothetical protein
MMELLHVCRARLGHEIVVSSLKLLSSFVSYLTTLSSNCKITDKRLIVKDLEGSRRGGYLVEAL